MDVAGLTIANSRPTEQSRQVRAERLAPDKGPGSLRLDAQKSSCPADRLGQQSGNPALCALGTAG